MLPEQKQYIINLSNLYNSEQSLVGELVVEYQKFLSAGVPIPMGFVLTTTAFDDYLIANKLVNKIGSFINDTNYTDEVAVREVAKKIKDLIIGGVMPQIIADPISKAYGGMSGFTDAGVNLLTSCLNSDLGESISKGGNRRYQVMGIANVILAIKDIWAEFFSFDALMYRHNIGYEGPLTEAVIIQKMIFPEISGQIYSFDTSSNSRSVFEIQAIWGGEDQINIITPDIYYLDSISSELIGKKVAKQEEMLIRKNKYDGRGLFSKVKISESMQDRSKLDNNNLQQLFVYTTKVLEIIGKPVKLKYCIEGGRLYIVEHIYWQEEEMPETTVFLNNKSTIDVDEKEPVEPVEDVASVENIETVEKEEIESNVNETLENFKKDLDNYVSEIEIDEIPGVNVEVQSTPRFGQPLTEDELIHEPIESIIPKEEVQSEKAEELVVDVKPINSLDELVQGKGNLKGEKFGVSHIVFEKYDYEDLTGDEILIVKEVEELNINYLNKVKGVIVENDIDSKFLDKLIIPVISGVKNISNIIRDREAITIDSNTGKVYLGAGLNDIAKLEKEEEITLPTQEKTEPVIDFKKVEQTYTENKYNINIYDNAKLAEVKTTSDFWQTLDDDIFLEIKNSNGIILTADYLFKRFSIDINEVFTDKKVFKEFLFKSIEFIKELIIKSNSQYIIYLSASKELIDKNELSGNYVDLITVDLQLINYLRDRENLKKIWYGFSDIITPEELNDKRRVISDNGNRRSATFKLFAHVTNIYPLIAAKSLINLNNIDGIIIHLDELMKNIGVSNVEFDDNTLNFLSSVIDFITSNNSQVFICTKKVVLSDTQIRVLLESGVTDFITTSQNIMPLKLQVSDQELSILMKQKRKGRKRKKKNIDFGF